MRKRLLEIVLYILDHPDDQDENGRSGSEALRAVLDEAGFDGGEILRALRTALSTRSEDGGEFEGDAELSLLSATLSREAWDYLERLRLLGLLSDEESGEVLHRAAGLPTEDVDLESIRFLAASIIFDREAGGDAGGLEASRIH